MGGLICLDYIILSAVAILVAAVIIFTIRDSRKKKSSGCSDCCASCSYSCDTPSNTHEYSDAKKQDNSMKEYLDT